MNLEKIKYGLRLISGDFLPPGWIPTSEEAKESAQKHGMLEFINDYSEDGRVVLDGTYYILASRIAKIILAEINLPEEK